MYCDWVETERACATSNLRRKKKELFFFPLSVSVQKTPHELKRTYSLTMLAYFAFRGSQVLHIHHL